MGVISALYEVLVISAWILYKLFLFIVGSIFPSSLFHHESHDITTRSVMDVAKVAKNLVKSVATGENVAIETFWQAGPCVITFLRRFGCPFCRVGARRLSEIKPRLDQNNVRFVGVGLEEVGVDEFVKGNFFSGELYIDTKKESYKALGFKRLGLFNLFPSVFGKKAREMNSAAKKDNMGGNMAGDGMQNGGLLVVDKGGKLLLSFKQELATDHVANEDVLKALGLSTEGFEKVAEGSDIPAGEQATATPKVVCEEDVCKKV